MHIAWGSFLLALLVIVLVPGPDFVLVTRSAANGARWGWLAAAGVTCGLLVHATAATLGLSALVATAPAALRVARVGQAVTTLRKTRSKQAPSLVDRL
ncbi:LysE family transporter [Saccharopolyspora sp. 5N708]|uniref:LysE family transporter n=1 Tax=Saccharopolyspora sp. 5N708 TaxID=3457424 RepID=UPI003FD149DA